MVCLDFLSSRRGLVAAFFSIVSLTVSDMLVYASGHSSHPLIIVFWNSAVICFLSFGCILITKSTVSQPNLKYKLLLLSLTGMLKGCGDVALTCANIYATPGNAIAILYTMPIFTIAFSISLLGDKCRHSDAILAVFAIAGVMFIVKSEFISEIFSGSNSNDVSEDDSTDNLYYTLGVMLALCSSAMNAAALVVGRYIGEREVSPLFILLLIGLSESIISTILCSILGLWTLPDSPMAVMKLVGIGIAGFWGILAMFYAVANERPTLISIVLAFQVLFVFVGQYFLFNVGATWASAVGAVFLVAACIGASLNTGEESTSHRSIEDDDGNARHQNEEDELLLTEKQR